MLCVYTALWEVLMRYALATLSVLALSLTTTLLAQADGGAQVGSAAPDFRLPDSQGKETSLSQFKGKTVVLEWFNPGCPFVKKFYSGGDMQRFQKTAREKGAVWLTINSNAEGKPGYISQEKAADVVGSLQLQSTALLLDPKGSVGRSYGARTTPHMYVIDPKGTLVYAGAIDNEPSTDSSDIAQAQNYVLNAVESVASGRPIEPNSTEPYGCSVKY